MNSGPTGSATVSSIMRLTTGKRFSTNRRHKAKKVQVRALCGADRSGYGTADRREDAEAINVVRVVNSMII